MKDLNISRSSIFFCFSFPPFSKFHLF